MSDERPDASVDDLSAEDIERLNEVRRHYAGVGTVQREINRVASARREAYLFGGPDPQPSAHAQLLLQIKDGDQLAAWMLALLILRYTPKSDPAQRLYWVEVAEAVAQCRPTHLEPQFFRGRQFVSPRRAT